MTDKHARKFLVGKLLVFKDNKFIEMHEVMENDVVNILTSERMNTKNRCKKGRISSVKVEKYANGVLGMSWKNRFQKHPRIYPSGQLYSLTSSLFSKRKYKLILLELDSRKEDALLEEKETTGASLKTAEENIKELQQLCRQTYTQLAELFHFEAYNKPCMQLVLRIRELDQMIMNIDESQKTTRTTKNLLIFRDRLLDTLSAFGIEEIHPKSGEVVNPLYHVVESGQGNIVNNCLLKGFQTKRQDNKKEEVFLEAVVNTQR